MGDHSAGKLECSVCGIVGGAGVWFSCFIDPFFDVGGSKTRYCLYIAEEVIEDVAPMAKHIQNHAAAILFAIIPGRSLRRHGIALENPIPEFAAHRKNF